MIAAEGDFHSAQGAKRTETTNRHSAERGARGIDPLSSIDGRNETGRIWLGATDSSWLPAFSVASLSWRKALKSRGLRGGCYSPGLAFLRVVAGLFGVDVTWNGTWEVTESLEGGFEAGFRCWRMC